MQAFAAFLRFPKRLAVPVFSVLISLVGAAAPARATVLDTFAFSNIVIGTGITGEFSGAVEPGGLIELSDLTAFQIEFLFGWNIVAGYNTLTHLSLFSYNTAGVASSLDIVEQLLYTGCLGAVSVLSPACNSAGTNPASTLGVILSVTTPIFLTSNSPTVTLIAVPEPSTWTTLLLGFAGLGYVGYRKAKAA
jgi:hypothetical protein